jgi:hypothetical protein
MSKLLELVQIQKEAIVWSERRIKVYNDRINGAIMTGEDTTYWKNLRDSERETVAAIKLELGSAVAAILNK